MSGRLGKLMPLILCGSTKQIIHRSNMVDLGFLHCFSRLRSSDIQKYCNLFCHGWATDPVLLISPLLYDGSMWVVIGSRVASNGRFGKAPTNFGSDTDSASIDDSYESFIGKKINLRQLLWGFIPNSSSWSGIERFRHDAMHPLHIYRHVHARTALRGPKAPASLGNLIALAKNGCDMCEAIRKEALRLHSLNFEDADKLENTQVYYLTLVLESTEGQSRVIEH